MNKNYIVVILLVLAALCIIFNTQISDTFTKHQQTQKVATKEADVNIEPVITGVVDIPVNPPTTLSYKTKKEIYSLRTNFVQNSIFKNPAYKPSDEVFGNIESGKPWMSIDICKDLSTKLIRVDGPSEEARFINNPALLVAIEYPFTFTNEDVQDWCTDSVSTLIPQKITYHGNTKEIVVQYEKLPFTTNGNNSFYTFNGLNARDLGYHWAYIDSEKSTYKVDFVNSDNISNQIVEFQNYIHLGSSCGHSSGCNNGSPRQTYLEFKEDNTEYNYTGQEIYIKLWKSKPNSPSAKPDIVERIILNWS